jgi:hypothetical protein
MNERRNVPEIVIAIPRIASQIPNSDQSPLYDVRNPARPSDKDATCEVMFRGRLFWLDSRARLRSFELSRARFDRPCPAAPRIAEGEAWWSQTGSNRRPHACKARALPAELWPRNQKTNASRWSWHFLQEKTHSIKWWAWEDLNFRPHAYQARALTN